MFALLVLAAQVLFWSTTTAAASPIPGPSSLPTQVGAPAVSPNTNATPTPSVLPPTDGGGQGFSIPAILWIIFCALIGLPLAITGVRGWKVTSGVGIGLSLTILRQSPCSRSVSGHTDIDRSMRCHSTFTVYASFINTMGPNGLADNNNTSDLFLDAIVFIAFFVGVGCGWFRLGTNGGPVLLGACGGLALAFMALLLRPGLLFGSFYIANWLLAGPLGIAGAAFTIFRQKFGVVRTTFSICPLKQFLSPRLDLRQRGEWLVPTRTCNRSRSQQTIRDEQWSPVIIGSV